MAELAVQRLGGWVGVSLLDGEGRPEQIAVEELGTPALMRDVEQARAALLHSCDLAELL